METKLEVLKEQKVVKNSELFFVFGLTGFKDKDELKTKIQNWRTQNKKTVNGRGKTVNYDRLKAQIGAWMADVNNTRGKFKNYKFLETNNLTKLIERKTSDKK